MAEINQIIVSGVEYDIQTTTAISAQTAVSAVCVNGMYENESGNLEINNAHLTDPKAKVNVVSKGAIQIKPGIANKTTIRPLQLDCEYGESACTEYTIKICNGQFTDGTEVVGVKLNTSNMVLDTQNSNTSIDKTEFEIKARQDTWNGGESTSDKGPVALKVKARAHDIRCYDHGGIALQIAGQDGDGNENKVKFESSRISEIVSAATYCNEGGKGLEFGTFNNLHTSLYTGDYRFKGDAKVYPVTREPIEYDEETEKTDYPTQADDFKDVIDEDNCATWNQIIAVAKNGGMASGYVYTAGNNIEITPEHVINVTGITSGGSIQYIAGEGIDITDNVISATGGTNYEAGEGIVISGNTISTDEGLVLLKDHARITDSGNLEFSVSGSDTNMNFASEKNIKMNAASKVRVCSPDLNFDYEIDKEGNIDGYGFSNLSFTFKNKLNKTKVTDEVWGLYSGVTCSGCVDASTETKIDRTLDISVPVIDLIRLIDRVSALEAKVTELETRMNGYHPDTE